MGRKRLIAAIVNVHLWLFDRLHFFLYAQFLHLAFASQVNEQASKRRREREGDSSHRFNKMMIIREQRTFFNKNFFSTWRMCNTIQKMFFFCMKVFVESLVMNMEEHKMGNFFNWIMKKVFYDF